MKLALSVNNKFYVLVKLLIRVIDSLFMSGHFTGNNIITQTTKLKGASNFTSLSI